MARGVGMRETCRGNAMAHAPAHALAHAPAHAPTQAPTHAPVHASSWVSFAVLWPAPLLPPERGGWPATGRSSSEQLARLGGGLPAVLGRVLLCCRQPALKVLQLALEVLLLALKVLYERLKARGRVFVGVQTPTLLLQPF